MEYICGNALNKNLKDRIDRSKTKLSKEIAYTISTKQDRRCGDANFILDGYGETSIEDFLKIKNATKKGYLEATDGDGIDISSRMKYHRGNVQKDKVQTLTTSGGNDRGVCVGTYQYAKSDKFMNGKDRLQLGKEVSDTLQTTPKEAICYNDLRIRKLSPRECGRLMGVKDKDITNMLKNQSDSSAYHCFGDSIICTVLCAIFGELLDINWIEKFKEIEDKFIDK